MTCHFYSFNAIFVLKFCPIITKDFHCFSSNNLRKRNLSNERFSVTVKYKLKFSTWPCKTPQPRIFFSVKTSNSFWIQFSDKSAFFFHYFLFDTWLKFIIRNGWSLYKKNLASDNQFPFSLFDHIFLFFLKNIFHDL